MGNDRCLIDGRKIPYKCFCNNIVTKAKTGHCVRNHTIHKSRVILIVKKLIVLKKQIYSANLRIMVSVFQLRYITNHLMLHIQHVQFVLLMLSGRKPSLSRSEIGFCHDDHLCSNIGFQMLFATFNLLNVKTRDVEIAKKNQTSTQNFFDQETKNSFQRFALK